MSQLEVDSSNSCIPPLTSPLTALFCPLPSTTRGEPTILDGSGGRLNSNRPLVLYGSGRLVIVRELSTELSKLRTLVEEGTVSKNGATIVGSQSNPLIQGFVYRGHMARVTTAKFAPSGAYVASADVKGCVRVWSYDNDEHLCKLDLKGVLSGPIRDLAWDVDGKRVSHLFVRM